MADGLTIALNSEKFTSLACFSFAKSASDYSGRRLRLGSWGYVLLPESVILPFLNELENYSGLSNGTKFILVLPQDPSASS